MLNLEEIALALVAQGKGKLDKGNRDGAAELFGSAASLAPNLPDGHLARALAAFKKGPLGLRSRGAEHDRGRPRARFPPPAAATTRSSCSCPSRCSPSSRPAAIFSLAIVLRHGPLLRHDIEEALGSRRSPERGPGPPPAGAPPARRRPSRDGAGSSRGGWRCSSSTWACGRSSSPCFSWRSSLVAVPALNLLDERMEMARNRALLGQRVRPWRERRIRARPRSSSRRLARVPDDRDLSLPSRGPAPQGRALRRRRRASIASS